MCIFLQFLIALILPLFNSIAMPNHNLKISIQQQNDIIFHALDIQSHWLRVAVVEIVLKKSRLDHYQRICSVFSKQGAFVERGFVRGRAESLNEVGTT
jgi:hypothetical protein